MFDWIWNNREWIFSGFGLALIALLYRAVRRRATPIVPASPPVAQTSGPGSTSLQAGRDLSIAVAMHDTATLSDPRDARRRNLKQTMPDLLRELRSVLSIDAHRFVRDIVVVPNRNVVFGWSSPHVIFCEQEDPLYQSQLIVLENSGMVQRIFGTSLIVYRMSEEFVEFLLAE